MRFMERAVIALLGVWCVISIAQTAQALMGPAGWVAGRPEAASGFVGMPLPGADAVVAIGQLLGTSGDVDGLALVILSAEVNATPLAYIRYQLAHTRYPQRVDVTTETEAASAGSRYEKVIAAEGIRLGAPWRLKATLGGFSAYEREGS